MIGFSENWLTQCKGSLTVCKTWTLLLRLVVVGFVLFTANALRSAELLVSAWADDKILQFNATTGSFEEDLVPARRGGMDNPAGMAIGPDGSLYVANGWTNSVLRYDLTTGDYLGVFATNAQIPIGLTFGKDGNLYVASRDGQGVLRYNGQTGASMGRFASASTGDLWWAWDLAFGPTGDLFVTSFQRGRVLRFDGTDGTYKGVFASGGGMQSASGLTFGPDGKMYVSDYSGNAVYRFDSVTGQSLGRFASGNGLQNPGDLAFGPDGNLYVTNDRASGILRFDGTNGQFIDNFTSGASWSGADFLLFTPVPEPSTLALLGMGSAGLIALGSRKRARHHGLSASRCRA